MTLPGMMRQRHDAWKDQACMLVKRGGSFAPVTWAEYYGAALSTARALIRRGLESGDRAAILSHTRYEWAVADIGVLSAGCVSVPLYPSLSRGEVGDLLQRSGARTLFASDAEQVQKCLPLLDRIESLEFLVAFESAALEGASPNPRVLALTDLVGEGHDAGEDLVTPRMERIGEEDPATIIFTSGTTGEPKGVTLTHRNILSNIEACLQRVDIGQQDTCLAHLPLAHILERMGGYYLMLSAGATIAYAESIQTVAEDIATVRPTVAVSVPRIFEKIYAGIQNRAVEAPAPVKALTFWALRVARAVGTLQAEDRPLPGHLGLQRMVADRLVFAKIRRKLGGRLRFFISGGAPLSPELAKFFNAIGVQIYEGYGLTETSPVIAVNFPGRNRVGTVGLPLTNVEVRIDSDGEILARGPSVFSGYYRNQAATREAFTEDGFFRTGDIGELDADGFLKITDRKKDLIVTAGGKNVPPQKVENVLKMSKYISEAMLYGDRKRFITALIVPDPTWLSRYAAWKQLPEKEISDLVENPAVVDYYRRLVADLQEKAGLAPHESVRKFVLLGAEFSAAGGEVTPTMKIRRRQITEHYRDRLEALYAEG